MVDTCFSEIYVLIIFNSMLSDAALALKNVKYIVLLWSMPGHYM